MDRLRDALSRIFRRRCRVCNNLEVRWYDAATAARGWVDADELKRNCKFCQMLKAMLIHFSTPNDPSDPTTEATIEHHVGLQLFRKGPILVHTFVTTKSDRTRARDALREQLGTDIFAITAERSEDAEPLSFLIYLERACPLLPTLGTLRPASPSFSLGASASFASHHIKECLDKHPDCIKLTKPGAPLPTRVLSIGSSDSSPIHLVQPGGTHAKYATLSHCWGAGPQPLRTVGSNLEAMHASIEPAQLPIVFEQAIQVARALSIEYIWIDSLCIIQDDQADWETESAKMCDYYEDAFLNISTAASPDHGTPFLGQKASTWRPYKYDLRSGNPRGGAASHEVFAKRIPDVEDGDAEEGQLFTRAWTWQESALAARTLYFTTSRLVFECRTHVVQDDGALDVGALRLGYSRNLARLKLGAAKARQWKGQTWPRGILIGAREVASSAASAWNLWKEVVETYSRRQLTYPTDKLPALSGVARLFERVVDDQYLAGLWRQHMPENLCWRLSQAESSKPILFQPGEYVAPSWSWASVTQGVEFLFADTPGTSFESHVEVIDVGCSVLGLNPLGRVSDGHIVLRGRVAEAKVGALDAGDTANRYHPPDVGWELVVDCRLKSKEDGRLVRAPDGETELFFSAQTLYMMLGRFSFDRGAEMENGQAWCALLLGRPAADRDEWCRAGIMWTSEVNTLFDGVEEKDIRIV